MTPLIGNTPLVRIQRIARGLPPEVEIYAKAEWLNPGGSVKDRPALRMIEKGEASGALTRDKTILDATSGNTGIALAMLGAVKGYRVELCIPENVSEERKVILKAYGAKIHWSDPLEGSDGAIRLANRMQADSPDKFFRPDQYGNPENWRAHYTTTGPEIWAQTEGRVTHFVAAMGTSGTVTGTGRFLREKKPDIEIVAVEPEPFHGIEGLKHMGTSIVPPIYDPSVHTQKLTVTTEDAYQMERRIAAEEGMLVGQSAGANLWAAMKVAREVERGVIVCIFCDSGDKYLSTRVWQDA
ncbi:MAG: cysteine synthase family protein [Candidatus Methylomirabilis sp.]|nr:cysteine synthase family protein [Deltaproteobacteria bacterium]